MNKVLLVSILLLIFIGSVHAGLTDNLVSYYKFDETSGTTLIDSLNNNNGTNNGVTINQTGIIKKTYYFDGLNDYISLANESNFDFLTNFTSQSFTVNMWIKSSETPADLYNLFGKWDHSGVRGFTIDVRPNGVIYAQKYTMSTNNRQKYTGNTTALNGNWNFITVTVGNGDDFNIYLNGVQQSTSLKSTGTLSNINISQNAEFGRRDGFYYYDGLLDEAGIWNRILTQNEITELYNSGNGLIYPFDVNAIFADFDYSVNGLEVDLNDTSTILGNAVIDSWEWLINDVSVSNDQNYSFTGVEATDYNVCLIIQDTTLSLEDSTCQTISISDLTPPTTTFSYEQINGTTDTNITLTCTDNNSGCKTINYNINNEGWKQYTKLVSEYIGPSENITGATWDWLDDETINITNPKIFTDMNFKATSDYSNVYQIRFKFYEDDIHVATSNENTISLDTNKWYTITGFEDYNINKIIVQNKKTSVNGSYTAYIYGIGEELSSFLYSGTGDHNIQFYSTDNADNNETIKTQTFNTSGLLRLNFFDDTTKNSLNQVYLEFNGTPHYSDSNNFIYIDLNGLTSGSKTILLQRTGYQEKSFSLNLNQYSDLNYQIGFIKSSNISEVDFQVFTETGALKPNTSFTVTDNDNNYLIDIKTTDSQGRVTFYLNNQKSDYNFVSTDLNFGTTLWTINKPKDASTLIDIVGNWKYSITGNSYSSGTNIVASVQKILLQNTVNPYYIKIQDVSENYAESSFGLKSITSEKTKTLDPFIYPFGSAELKLIKLLDFSTNQPISTFNELLLSLYTDSNGLIEIGTYINDSTGTYNIYMDSNAQYKLVIDEQTFILKPTLSVYYLYLTTPSGLHVDTNTPLVDNNWVDLNSPTIILEVRQFFFGCSIEKDNCYPSMVFALIAMVILSIGFVGLMRLGPLEQSVINIILLSVFTFIGFIPLWLFGITLVIILAWGVFA